MDKIGPIRFPESSVGCSTTGKGVLRKMSAGACSAIADPQRKGRKKGGFVVQCDKNDYRGILLGLDGVTGKKALDSGERR
jgi:hypothetical protein